MLPQTNASLACPKMRGRSTQGRKFPQLYPKLGETSLLLLCLFFFPNDVNGYETTILPSTVYLRVCQGPTLDRS